MRQPIVRLSWHEGSVLGRTHRLCDWRVAYLYNLLYTWSLYAMLVWWSNIVRVPSAQPDNQCHFIPCDMEIYTPKGSVLSISRWTSSRLHLTGLYVHSSNKVQTKNQQKRQDLTFLSRFTSRRNSFVTLTTVPDPNTPAQTPHKSIRKPIEIIATVYEYCSWIQRFKSANHIY